MGGSGCGGLCREGGEHRFLVTAAMAHLSAPGPRESPRTTVTKAELLSP